MRNGKRQVLVFEDQSAIEKVLNVLSAGIDSECGIFSVVRENLEGFGKHGCKSLMLTVRLEEQSQSAESSGISNISAYVLGTVLVVNCQATAAWITYIVGLHRQHFSISHVISSLTSFVQALF